MVNVGGPSKGCTTCIKRKIRCDRQQPACSQCLTTKRQCEGYRDAVAMMFRDQSQEIITKALTRSKGRVSTSTTATPRASNSPDESPTTDPAVNAFTLRHSPKLAEENGLITFLLNNFTSNDPTMMRDNLFWIPRNYSDLLKDDSAKLSVQCAGAMALSRLRRSPEYLRKAQVHYSLAVLSLAGSWQHTSQNNKDATFIAVLFLGLFELLASYGPSSRQSWTAHLGALGGLFEQRGDQYIHTEFGLRMFRQSRSQVIVNALQTRTAVPKAYARLSRYDRSMIPLELKPSDDVDMLLIRLADLQATHKMLKSATSLGPALMLLDLDLRKWTTDVPDSWSFSKQPHGQFTEMWWDVRSDIYSSAIMTNVWNKVRAARIAIRDLLLDINARSSSAQVGDARGVRIQFDHLISGLELQQLVIDACATVPVYYRPWSTTTEVGRAANPPALGIAFWSLSVLNAVGSMKSAPPALTQWSVQCLEQIHEKTGIVKAQSIAHKLKMMKRRASSGM